MVSAISALLTTNPAFLLMILTELVRNANYYFSACLSLMGLEECYLS